MVAPKWFLKELAMIDTRYFPIWNELYGYWEIKVRMKVDRTVEVPEQLMSGTSDGIHFDHIKSPAEALRWRAENPTVEVGTNLNDRLLNELRRRKYLKLKYKHDDDEIEDILDQNRQAKEKAGRLGFEMVAEGLIKLDKIQTHRSWTYDMAPRGGAT